MPSFPCVDSSHLLVVLGWWRGGGQEGGRKKESQLPSFVHSPLRFAPLLCSPRQQHFSQDCNSQFSPTGLINQQHVKQLLVSCRCLFFTAPGTLGLCFSLCHWSLTALPDSAAVPGPALPSAVSPLGIAYTRLTSPLCL